MAALTQRGCARPPASRTNASIVISSDTHPRQRQPAVLHRPAATVAPTATSRSASRPCGSKLRFCRRRRARVPPSRSTQTRAPGPGMDRAGAPGSHQRHHRHRHAAQDKSNHGPHRHRHAVQDKSNHGNVQVRSPCAQNGNRRRSGSLRTPRAARNAGRWTDGLPSGVDGK